MSLAKRIIPCLDVDNGRVVKGVQFVAIRDAGDPVEIARRYNEQGADEITFLDITASAENRDTTIHTVERIAREVFIPLTVGGGVRSVADIRQLLSAGADKVAINTAAIANPDLVREAAERFGSQCIVVAIDAKRVAADLPLRCLLVGDDGQPGSWETADPPRPPAQPSAPAGAGQPAVRGTGTPVGGNARPHVGGTVGKPVGGDAREPAAMPHPRWEVVTHGGRRPTGLDALEWARSVTRLGAGEILLTSMDRDGTKDGFDLALTRAVADGVAVPVIASGGVGNLEHLAEGVLEGGADAVLAASIFHYGEFTIPQAKEYMAARGIEVRL